MARKLQRLLFLVLYLVFSLCATVLAVGMLAFLPLATAARWIVYAGYGLVVGGLMARVTTQLPPTTYMGFLPLWCMGSIFYAWCALVMDTFFRVLYPCL